MPEQLTDAELAALAHELRTTAGGLTRALREHGGRLGLTPSQAEALGFVYRAGSLTVSELARRSRMRPQSMGATVAALVDEGLLQTRPHPTDGRQKVLTATARGRRLVADSRAIREDWLAGRIATLTAAEQRRLHAASELLARLISEEP